MKRCFLLIFIGVVAVACAGTASPTSTPTPTSVATSPSYPTVDAPLPEIPPDLSRVPFVETAQRIVPLAEVVFDTFNGSFVPLDQADGTLIARLRDAIRPIYQPAYHDVDAARGWLSDADRIIGMEVAGQAYAYPVKTLNFREIVNEELGGTPMAITYCPLCASGVVYDRRLDGQTLLFGNTSDLYDNDMVMFDHGTGSYWHQLSGQAIVGTLAGERLTPLPSVMATFGQWRALHPGTRVLSNTFTQAAGAGDPLPGIQQRADAGRFFFPLSEGATGDDRLTLGTQVLLLRVSG